MIKKLLVLGLMISCFSPSFAQGKKIIEAGRSGSSLTEAVTRQTAQTLKRTSHTPGVQFARIINLPDGPLVKLGGSVDNGPAVLAARMLRGADSYYILRPCTASGAYTGEVFLPQDILKNEKSFYRGMRLEKIDDLKNLLINGLEIDKTHYRGEIFTSLDASVPLWYATMGNEHRLIVLIKIPVTESLRSYAPEAWPIEDRYAPRRSQRGDEVFFRRDVPIRFISDVWIFWEVDGKPDWYKVTLENDELVFTRAPSRMFTDVELIRHEFGSRL
ncbi:MAG: hypothetical protein IKP96_05785 [Elusimicrobiaceae bacterium]|nr:hypothetical protein [Elusimicrobiaceae bacterium]